MADSKKGFPAGFKGGLTVWWWFLNHYGHIGSHKRSSAFITLVKVEKISQNQILLLKNTKDLKML
jgi:hypothetical protein